MIDMGSFGCKSQIQCHEFFIDLPFSDLRLNIFVDLSDRWRTDRFRFFFGIW